LNEKFIIIGKIISAHGNKGELKIKPLTEDIGRFSHLKYVLIDKKKYEICYVKRLKNDIILKLTEVAGIDDAEDLVGFYTEVERSNAIKLPVNSYFIHDIIGMDVYIENDKYLGKINDIIQTGSNDVYIVEDKDGKELLIPAIKDVVKKIDLDSRKIFIQYIEGLL